jgi:hypothetical protein
MEKEDVKNTQLSKQKLINTGWKSIYQSEPAAAATARSLLT